MDFFIVLHSIFKVHSEAAHLGSIVKSVGIT